MSPEAQIPAKSTSFITGDNTSTTFLYDNNCPLLWLVLDCPDLGNTMNGSSGK